MAPLLPPRSIPKFLSLGLIPISLSLILSPLIKEVPTLHPVFEAYPALSASIGFSILAGLATSYVVPALGETFIAKGFGGKDMCKVASDMIPESMGLPAASIYILVLLLFIPFPFTVLRTPPPSPSLLSHLTGTKVEHLDHERSKEVPFAYQELATYLSSILTLLLSTLLGLCDDIFDIRWRHKLPIPLLGSIPLLLVYYAQGGITTIVLPKGTRWIYNSVLGQAGHVVDVGFLYYLYMGLLSTFTTNSINIIAGINGVEVIQALIIGLSVCFNDVLYLPIWGGQAILQRGGEVMLERHLSSLYFMLPLVGVCTGLLYHNWYPARVFVGDTFCYFSGMSFAVVAIQSHFPKTLLLLFIPQTFNFLLSCPQLFGLVECPRHRLPKYNSTTNKLTNSLVTFKSPPPLRTTLTLKFLSALRLVKLTYETSHNKTWISSSTNLTILNFLLLHLGSMSEERLVVTMGCVQIAGSIVAFAVRYGMVSLFYDGDRR